MRQTCGFSELCGACLVPGRRNRSGRVWAQRRKGMASGSEVFPTEVGSHDHRYGRLDADESGHPHRDHGGVPVAVNAHWTLPCAASSVGYARGAVRGVLEAAGSSSDERDAAALVITELLANAIIHGGRS